MGPPTGWHRLRLLREILDELVPGVEQFLLINNVVAVEDGPALVPGQGCFRHQLLLPRPYLVLTKPLRLDIQCQRGASVKIGWKYLDD